MINDHPETATAEGEIVPQAKFVRIMVSKRVFHLPELIIFLIRNHQVMQEIPPGDAERPLRHLWLRACRIIQLIIFSQVPRCRCQVWAMCT